MTTARRSRFNRRSFLRGAGTVAVGLPFLESLPERSAWGGPDDTGGPPIFSPPIFSLFIVAANGVVQRDGREAERFWPTSVGPLTTASMEAFAAERSTGILAPHASRLLMVRGINYAINFPTGCGHAQGSVMCLTGAPPGGGTSNDATPNGPSADVVISNLINDGNTPLALYAGRKEGYMDENISFTEANGIPRSAQSNPYFAYQDLMGFIPPPDVEEGPSEFDLIFMRRQSVNDLVRGELEDLRRNSRLSQADRERLDLHFQSIRDIEVGMMSMAASCAQDSVNMTAIDALQNNFGGFGFWDDNQESVSQLHMELIGLAFACNARRVATLQLGDGIDHTRYLLDGQRVEGFHQISHRINSDGTQGTPIEGALEKHIAIDRIRMQTFLHLLDRWSEYRVENGSMLDNAFVLWTNQIAAGPSHSFRNVPMIIAGNAGGAIRQGEYIDAGGVTNDRFLNTLISVATRTEFTNLADRNGGVISDMLV